MREVSQAPMELTILRAAYEHKYKRSMDHMIQGELSMKTLDAFNIALQGRWQDNGYVDQFMLQRDINDLGSSLRTGFTDECSCAAFYTAALLDIYKLYVKLSVKPIPTA